MGGYERSTRPNPNSAMATFERRSQDGYQGGGSALGAGIGQMLRGMENRRAEDLANAQGSLARGVGTISTVLPDIRWEGLKQALYEAGVGRARTGARAGMGSPGFYDVQVPGQAKAYDPREAQFGGPPDNPYHQYQAGMARRAVDNLRRIR